jgi:molybdopterin/thiamine biosynthesis adenylyltransferase
MSRQQWYETFPEIFEEEKKALGERGFIFDEQSFETEKTVIFKGILPEFPERNIIIEYPRAYPSIAPIVSDDGACEVLPRHQKACNRVYCLFGNEGKAWWAGLTGAIALDETTRLLRDVLRSSETHEELPDTNPEPASAQTIFTTKDKILVPPGVSDHLPQDLTKATKGFFFLKFSDGKNAPFHKHGRGIVLKVRYSNESQEGECSPGYKGLFDDCDIKEGKGVVIFLPKLERPIYGTKDLIEILRKHGFGLESYAWHAVIFPEESVNRETTRYSWLIFHEKKKGTLPIPVETTTYRTSENSVRIPGLEWLKDKRVAIIGCGSIGSKVAVMLASSGVNKFTLVDKDHMEPSNSIRHECGIETFAYDKTHALINRLALINRECATGYFLFPGDPFGKCTIESFDRLMAVLKQCDLIVNTSGSEQVGHYLNQLAYQTNTPCLHASVTNGAWSGEVIRSIPGRTACWRCWDEAFSNCEPPGAPTPKGRVFGPGCDQPTFTGTSYEVGMLANLAASFAVDTLSTVEIGNSEYSGDYLLWEGKDADGKPLLRTTVQEIPHREKCPVCGNQT